jgi:hypothetical protein
MSDHRYRVMHSGAASEQLEAALAHAEAVDQKPQALEAAQWAWEEMERTPLEFGESRGYLPHAKLHKRIAFSGPLVFYFGVHDERPEVFVIRIKWTRKR